MESAQACRTLLEDFLSGKYSSIDNLEDQHRGETECAPLWRMLYESAQPCSDEAKWQFVLGVCHLIPRGGVKQDHALAVHWLTRAADQGLAQAHCVLGDCYANGVGVTKCEVHAAQLYLRFAEQGYAAAQFNLGRCFQHGIGAVKDEPRAVRLYQLAAEQGHLSALEALGRCYDTGAGVPKDVERANECFLQAAEGGYQPLHFWSGLEVATTDKRSDRFMALLVLLYSAWLAFEFGGLPKDSNSKVHFERVSSAGAGESNASTDGCGSGAGVE